MKTLCTSCLHELRGILLGIVCVVMSSFNVTAADRGRSSEEAVVTRVGPNRPVKTLAQASMLAKDGDTIEVDAGDYVGDVAVWSQNRITIKAVNGRVRLIANGRAAEGKGIWVVRADQVRVQGFDFVGARVPDGNGAGIRLESGSLLVHDCLFRDNENGILTSNSPQVSLEVENSEFAFNGAGDGLSHNLYAGAITSLTVTGSYFHHANVGHLLKSRAAVNRIRYNRLTDEVGGRASYELNLPNGGVAFVIGNIIQQSASTENPHLISYGEEGYRWPRNALYLINNTLIDKRQRAGTFMRITRGPAQITAANNLLVGLGALEAASPGDYRNNTLVQPAAFAAAEQDDYRLKRNSYLRDVIIDMGHREMEALMPQGEYRHPLKWAPLAGPARHPGALQTLK